MRTLVCVRHAGINRRARRWTNVGKLNIEILINMTECNMGIQCRLLRMCSLTSEMTSVTDSLCGGRAHRLVTGRKTHPEASTCTHMQPLFIQLQCCIPLSYIVFT